MSYARRHTEKNVHKWKIVLLNFIKFKDQLVSDDFVIDFLVFVARRKNLRPVSLCFFFAMFPSG